MNDNDVVLEILRRARPIVERNPDIDIFHATMSVFHRWEKTVMQLVIDGMCDETQAARLQSIDAAIAKLQEAPHVPS